MVWLTQGLKAKARDMIGRLQVDEIAKPLSAACVALAGFATDAESARKGSTGLAARFETLKETLPLLARIYAEILVEVEAVPSPYAAWLEETVPGIKIAFTRLGVAVPSTRRANVLKFFRWCQSIDVTRKRQAALATPFRACERSGGTGAP